MDYQNRPVIQIQERGTLKGPSEYFSRNTSCSHPISKFILSVSNSLSRNADIAKNSLMYYQPLYAILLVIVKSRAES